MFAGWIIRADLSTLLIFSSAPSSYLLPNCSQLSIDSMASTYSLPSDYTEDNPFSKKEMSLFVVVYTSCVILLIIMYEHLMPVINNPTYPHYNKVPSFEFVSPHKTTPALSGCYQKKSYGFTYRIPIHGPLNSSFYFPFSQNHIPIDPVRMSITVAAPERSLHENNTAPNSLVASKRNNGFLSTLASYLTSTHKSDPKPVVQRRKLMNSWDEVDFVKLNALVCNVLYAPNSYEPLISEIERVVGRRREHCLYGATSLLLILVLLHDAIGALTVFMTLIVPTFFTISTASSSQSPTENQLLLKEKQEFLVKYWTVYAVFVAQESFIASLIQWDLRLLRLIFMSACLSSRIPILDAAYSRIIGIVSKVRELIEMNNYESAAGSAPKKLN